MISDKAPKGAKGFVNDLKNFNKADSKEQREFKFVLAYGFGFISMMFLGFLSGYFLGIYGLMWDHTNSLILSIAVGAGTMFLESVMLILRISSITEHDENVEERRNQNRTEIEILGRMANYQNNKLSKVGEEENSYVKSAAEKKND